MFRSSQFECGVRSRCGEKKTEVISSEIIWMTEFDSDRKRRLWKETNKLIKFSVGYKYDRMFQVGNESILYLCSNKTRGLWWPIENLNSCSITSCKRLRLDHLIIAWEYQSGPFGPHPTMILIHPYHLYSIFLSFCASRAQINQL